MQHFLFSEDMSHLVDHRRIFFVADSDCRDERENAKVMEERVNVVGTQEKKVVSLQIMFGAECFEKERNNRLWKGLEKVSVKNYHKIMR